MDTDVVTTETPRGPARITIDRPDSKPRCLLVLGHGAGGGVDAPDLVAVRDAMLPAGVLVARVTQPYRLAGRRTPPAAPVLDEAWIAAVRSTVRSVADKLAIADKRLPLILGGRSSGARVACRTARELGAVGVLALAFPLHPPGRPDRSRAPELDTGVPTLVLNGDADPFGVPDEAPGVTVVVRPGARHDLRRDVAGTAAIALDWLTEHGWARAGAVTTPRKRR